MGIQVGRRMAAVAKSKQMGAAGECSMAVAREKAC